MRIGWNRTALVLGALMLTGAAGHGATAKLYAAGYFSAGLFDTRTGSYDPMYMGLTAPRGGVFLDSHVWVSDDVLSFIKLTPDPALGIAEPHTPPPDAVGDVTANIAKPGQPAFDSGRSLAYFPSGQTKTGGVYRAVFRPGKVSGSFALPTLLAPGAGLDGPKPSAVALGPDGQLYAGFLNTGDIRRINNPAGVTQTVQTIGKTSKGGFSVIRNAAGCNSGCQAVLVPNSFSGQTHTGIATDGLDTIYLAVNNSVMRYSIAGRAQTLYANAGTMPNGEVVAFDMLAQMTAMFVDGAGNLYVGDDPTGGTSQFYGRLWVIAAGQ